jgi:hypothetical protein
MKSSLFRLNWHDLLKGLVIAILTPVLVLIQAYFATGKLDIELKSVLAVGFSGLLAYLIKNFFSDLPELPKVSASIGEEEEDSYVGGRPGNRKK